MEQAEIRKKYPIGSILLWLAAMPAIYLFINSLTFLFPLKFDTMPPYFVEALFISSITLVLAASLITEGVFSMRCVNKGVFICSVVVLAILTAFVILFNHYGLTRFLPLPGAVAFTFIIFTQAFNIPEKLKAVGAKLFFLPSILFAAAAIVFYLSVLLPGPQDSGLFIGLGQVIYWYSLIILIFIVIIPSAILAAACFFILKRAVDPYKKIKAE